MDEVERLQAVFKQLQKGDAKHKLSERNCVEIVLKLLELKKIDLIFTTSGKEYITPHQLELEIQDALLEHGGRLNVLELPSLLGVDANHIDAKVDDIVRSNPGQYRLVNGELITKYYLDRMAEEINEALQESGKISLSELGTRFSIASDFLQELVLGRLNRSIKGQLDGTILYTQSYVNRYSARVRGIFSAITRPTPMNQIIQKHGLHDNLFYSVMETLIEEGRVGGIVSKQQYVPSIYSHTRKAWIESFFEQNHFIDYQTLEKLQMTDGRQWLQQRYPHGLALPHHYLAKSLVEQADAAVAEAISSGQWMDVMTVLPTVLEPSDGALVLQACPSISKSSSSNVPEIFEECLVVSRSLIDRLAKQLEEHVIQKASAASSASPSLASSTDSTASSSNSSSKKALKKSQSKDNADDEDAAESPSSSLKSSKGGKGQQQSSAAQTKAKKGGGGKPSGGKGSNLKSSSSSSEEQEYLALLKKWLAEADTDERLLFALLKYLQPVMTAAKERAAKAIFLDNSQQKSKRKALEDEMNSLFLSLQLFHKCHSEMNVSEDESEAIEKHLLRTVCADLVNLVIQDQALSNCLSVDKVTSSNRSSILSQLPPAVSKTLDKLTKVKKVGDYITEMNVVADKFQLLLKSLDKKNEKTTALNHRQALMNQLDAEQNPSVAYQLVLLILYHKHFQAAIHVPTRILNTVLEKLKQKLAPEAATQLTLFGTKVVELLTKKAEAQKAAGEGAETIDEQKMPLYHELVSRLADLKALALGGGSGGSETRDKEEKKVVREGKEDEASSGGSPAPRKKGGKPPRAD